MYCGVSCNFANQASATWNDLLSSDDVMWRNELTSRGYTTRRRDGESYKDVFVRTRPFVRGLKAGASLKNTKISFSDIVRFMSHDNKTVAVSEYT